MSSGRGSAAAERDIDDLPRNDANYTALTPLWFLERAALAQPGRASVVHGPVRYTWADTYRRCRRFASALARRSVGHGSTVNSLIPLEFSPLNILFFEESFFDKRFLFFLPQSYSCL
jgi:acetate/butyrate---CoA ligase